MMRLQFQGVSRFFALFRIVRVVEVGLRVDIRAEWGLQPRRVDGTHSRAESDRLDRT